MEKTVLIVATILQYFELFTLQEWVNFLVKDIAFSAIMATIILKLFEWMRLRKRATDTVKFLCKNNHPTRKALSGKHLADRLLDVYNDGKPLPLVSRKVVYEKGNFWRSIWNEDVIDNILQEKGLVEIFEEQGLKKVRLSEGEFIKTVIKYLVKMVKREEI